MMKKILDKLDEIYKLKNLVRYNQRARIRPESVAEHSYFVVLFTRLICEEYDVPRDIERLAIDYAISHDIPEIHISDIPWPVKNDNPALEKVLNKLENDFMKKEFPLFHKSFVQIKETPVANTIVELADILSVLQYTRSEYQLGNKELKDVYDIAQSRYTEQHKKLLVQLEHYLQDEQPVLLIFEHQDKTGCTTTISNVDKASYYKHFMLDRGPLSYSAYSQLYNKGPEYDQLESQIMNCRHLQVYLTCDVDVIKQRFIDCDEPDLPGGQKIEDHKRVFDYFYEKSKLNKIKIDTGQLDPDQVLKVILDKIGEL